MPIAVASRVAGGVLKLEGSFFKEDITNTFPLQVQPLTACESLTGVQGSRHRQWSTGDTIANDAILHGVAAYANPYFLHFHM